MPSGPAAGHAWCESDTTGSSPWKRPGCGIGRRDRIAHPRKRPRGDAVTSCAHVSKMMGRYSTVRPISQEDLRASPSPSSKAGIPPGRISRYSNRMHPLLQRARDQGFTPMFMTTEGPDTPTMRRDTPIAHRMWHTLAHEVGPHPAAASSASINRSGHPTEPASRHLELATIRTDRTGRACRRGSTGRSPAGRRDHSSFTHAVQPQGMTP
jgi:hypothetical protein